MNGDIDKIITLVSKHIVFDENTYPSLKGKTDEEKFSFALNHYALHFSKTAGKIALVSEHADHGEEIDIEALRDNVPKALINVLRLAELVGMNEKEIIESIEARYSEKIK